MVLVAFCSNTTPPPIVFCNEPLIDSKYERHLPVQWAVAELAQKLNKHPLCLSPPKRCPRENPEDKRPLRTLTKFINSQIYKEIYKFTL